jgi:hypothetical protein
MPEARLQKTRDAYRVDGPPPTVFRMGVDVCRLCGTTGKYDCPECGVWRRPSDNAAVQILREAELRRQRRKDA